MRRGLAMVVIAAAGAGILAGSLPGCTEERVIEDNSATAKFMNMMNGTAVGGGETSGQWQVASNGSQTAKHPQDDPNVRVIKQADFSGYKFSTNLTVDDGKGAATQPAGGNPPPNAQPAPGTGLFGLPLSGPARSAP